MEDSWACKLSNLMSIRSLERREAANDKWLEEVQRMQWHTKGDNLVISAVLVKLRCTVAAVTVKDKQSVRSSCT